MDLAGAFEAHEEQDKERFALTDASMKRLADDVTAIRRIQSEMVVQNTTDMAAVKRAFADAMADRDAAKNAAASKRAWVMCAYIGALSVVTAVCVLAKVAPETTALIVGGLGASLWKGVDALAPVQPKSTGRTLPPPPGGDTQ